MTFLIMTRDNDPKYFLQMENGPGNVFVTQLGEHRKEEGEDVSQIPVMRESRSDILQHHRKALQTFRLQKKEIENKQASVELTAKKEKFKERMEMLDQRREALEQKDQERKNQILEFDTYIKECQKKKERVFQQYQKERKVTAVKKQEALKLKNELKKLQVRKKELQKKIAKYKKIEDFRNKVIRTFPQKFLENPEDSIVEALIKRHKTLSEENQSLMKNLSIQQCHIEQIRKELEDLQEKNKTATFMLLAKISELQSKKNTIQEKKSQLFHHINSEECLFSDKRQELSRMVLAINNMAELCYMHHYGTLDKMTLQSKLDMIQECFVRKKQILEETKIFKRDELARSSSHLLMERSHSTISREYVIKQTSFCCKENLEDEGEEA